MKPDFTPAAWRVLAEAACWTCGADEAPLDLPELLLGLIAEEECRAAGLLASRGIDAAAVRLRWPALRQVAIAAGRRTSDFSVALHTALAEARGRLNELPQPLSLATEHLLLGVLVTSSEASAWLAQRGFDAAELEAQIFRWEGVTQGPLESAECGVIESAECRVRSAESQKPPIASHSALLLRLLDASANRAREGLRVIEDYVRFVLDDGHLTAQLKHLRHRLAGLLAQFPTADLLASRETLADVGTQLSTPREQTRADLSDVVTANFKRLEESLRSLEEHSKTMDAALAIQLEQMRYQVYTLERAVAITADSRERLARARLYVLIDGRESPSAFEELATSLIAAGVHVLQLRDKRLDDRELLDRARCLRDFTCDTQTLFIMNDRPDLAALSQADGVHIGQEELTVKDTRAIVGPRALIGVSTHSIEQARQAVVDGASYIGVGPTFSSGTKRFDTFPGLDLLRSVSAEIRLPAFAIGGITLDNLAEVLATGIPRVAVSGAICASLSPADAARMFLRQM